MSSLPDFGKQVGPLPLGAWVAVIGGGLAVAVYSQRHSAAKPVEYVDNNSVEPGVGTGGVGAFSQTSGLSSTPTVAAEPIVDNEQWGRAAIQALLADGYDPNMSDSAIRKYLVTDVTSAQEYTLVGIALRKIGPPPVPLPPSASSGPAAPTIPFAAGFYRAGARFYRLYEDGGLEWISSEEYQALGQPQMSYVSDASPFWKYVHMVGDGVAGWSSLAGVGPDVGNLYGGEYTAATAPVPPSMASAAYIPPATPPSVSSGSSAQSYTVQAGDTLAAIAARYPNVSWQSLFNTNRGLIGSDPNTLPAGIVLTIA